MCLRGFDMSVESLFERADLYARLPESFVLAGCPEVGERLAEL